MKRADLRTILYVDDEPDIREVVELSISLVSNLQVVTCESGKQALGVLADVRPDLVLLDVMMPDLDGPGTLKAMRANPALEHIPVVFMTAKAMPQEVAKFRELGGVAVIAKPFDPMTLGEQVLKIWEALPDGRAQRQ